MGDIHTVIESYADYLLRKRKKLWTRFQQTRQDHPESALAEAAIFRVLQGCGVSPEVADVPNSGGPDFRCTGDQSGQFMVEATSFQPEKITRDTGLNDKVSAGISGHAFSLLTQQIDERAAEKRRQLEKFPIPGILAIASSHLGSALIFDVLTAEFALISQPFWIGGKGGTYTDLSSSLFLRLEDDGTITTKNSSISAVLLVSVNLDRSYVCGALNPAATHKFRSEALWMIPFAYLKDWPIENGRLRCDWTMGNQRTHIVEHKSIQVS